MFLFFNHLYVVLSIYIFFLMSYYRNSYWVNWRFKVCSFEFWRSYIWSTCKFWLVPCQLWHVFSLFNGSSSLAMQLLMVSVGCNEYIFLLQSSDVSILQNKLIQLKNKTHICFEPFFYFYILTFWSISLFQVSSI